MKLAHATLHMIIDWPENAVPVLTIEAPRQFRTLASELLRQCEGADGGFVLSESWEPLDIARICGIITDPLRLEFNGRQAATALTKWLKAEAMSERFHLQTQEAKQTLLQWFATIANESDEPLAWNDDLDTAQLLKAFNAHFEDEECTLPEKLLRYIRIAQSYLNQNCFFFIHLKQYLSKVELQTFYKDVLYRKVRILLLENIYTQPIAGYETSWVVDLDDCEIHPDDI